LAMCLRYYQRNPRLIGVASTSSNMILNWTPQVPMRVLPTVTLLTATPTGESLPWIAARTASGATIDATHISGANTGGDLNISGFSGLTAGNVASLAANQIEFSAEL